MAARLHGAALPPYATLLLNAGAPVLTVQAILGHKQIDTTLAYARLYDGTVAADYFRAMVQVENGLNPAENSPVPPPTVGELVALVDALKAGMLNADQQAISHSLRTGLLALAHQAGDGRAAGNP